MRLFFPESSCMYICQDSSDTLKMNQKIHSVNWNSDIQAVNQNTFGACSECRNYMYTQ